jgi:hypothetical protein
MLFSDQMEAISAHSSSSLLETRTNLGEFSHVIGSSVYVANFLKCGSIDLFFFVDFVLLDTGIKYHNHIT